MQKKERGVIAPFFVGGKRERERNAPDIEFLLGEKRRGGDFGGGKREGELLSRKRERRGIGNKASMAREESHWGKRNKAV